MGANTTWNRGMFCSKWIWKKPRCSIQFVSVSWSESSCVAGSWSITEKRPWHDGAPHPSVPNKASRLPAVKSPSVRLLLHPMALAETMDDRGACHCQEAWTTCRESRASTRWHTHGDVLCTQDPNIPLVCHLQPHSLNCCFFSILH